MPAARHDLIILGGGLAGGLAALALARARPDLDVALVEPASDRRQSSVVVLRSDVAAADAALIEPLVGHRWPGYDVRFPAHPPLDQPYRTIESEALDRAVRAAIPADALSRERGCPDRACSRRRSNPLGGRGTRHARPSGHADRPGGRMAEDLGQELTLPQDRP